MASSRDIISITRLKTDAAELVRQATEEGRTFVVTQNGAARVVVMDIAEFERLENTLALLKMIAQGEADIAAGRTATVDEAFADAFAALDE